MHTSYYPTESLDAFEVEASEFGEVESTEAGAEEAVFNETEETELAERLLEVADERELDRFLGTLITRAMGSSQGPASLQQLRGILRGTAKGVLPAICGPTRNVHPPTVSSVAGMAGDLLGLELEGVGAEDQEFEVARRFVRFAGESARNVPHFQTSAPPDVAARRAVGAAVLQELYECPRLTSEGLLNFEYPFLLAEDEELDYFLGKLVRSVGRAVGNVAKFAGRAVQSATHAVADVSSSVADKLGKIPVIGAGLKGLYGLTHGAMFQTLDNVVSGVRLDKVVSRHFESQIRNIKEVAPYAQTIISFVPGIGPGISGAISAGLSLAQGKPIDQVMIDAAIGAIPGGAFAQTAVKVGVAAAQGKPIADAAIDALPIPPVAKNGAKAAFHVMQDVAQGKRVDKALLAEANKQIQNLPPNLRKAAQVGIALGQGKKIQEIAKQQIPGLVGAGGPLAKIGQRLAQVDPIVAQVRKLAGPAAHGFDVAAGLMKHRLSPVEITSARKALTATDRKGFDMAIALHSARVFSNVRNRIQQVPSRLVAGTAQRAPAARAGALARGRRLPWGREVESLDEFEVSMPENGEIENFEAGSEESAFSETEEMELGAELLEITDENELDGFIGALIARAAGGARQLASSPELRALLRRAAKSALPMIGGAAGNLIAPGVGGLAGSRLAAAAGDLFGLELEGLSPEDQEFEVARRFVRFAGASARNAARSRGGLSPKVAAQRALGVAARRHAPGFFRQRQPRGARVGPSWPDLPDYAPAAPIPIEVTCHCCGTQQTITAPGATGDGASNDNTLPDNEPANTTEPQTQKNQKTEGTNMHDLGRTTMEISEEADFEFGESQDEFHTEAPFSEEEEAEHASQLLEISDEQELDQFLGDLLRKARRVVGGALKSPLLSPLGAYLKGAIKKVLPAAAGALGNMVLPGIGGQIGSQLASRASDLLGFEYEALSPEDQEFEVAKRMVRMVGTAVQNAAQAAPTVDPQTAARSAVVAAAQAHVPGLLQPQSPMAGPGHHHRPRSGKWYRRGRKILLVGV